MLRRLLPLIIFTIVVTVLVGAEVIIYKQLNPPSPRSGDVEAFAAKMVAEQNLCRLKAGQLWVGLVKLDSLKNQTPISLDSHCLFTSSWSLANLGPANQVYDLVACPLDPSKGVYVDYQDISGREVSHHAYFANICPQVTLSGEGHFTAGLLNISPWPQELFFIKTTSDSFLETFLPPRPTFS